MATTIDREFSDGGRHYRLEVIDDATVKLRLRCQRRWYVVASGRRGLPLGTIPWELRGIVKRLIAEERARGSVTRGEITVAA